MKGLKKFRKFCADNPKTAKDIGALAALTFLDAAEARLECLRDERRSNMKLGKRCDAFKAALAKVATCKDDNHPMLKLLGGIAHEALTVTSDVYQLNNDNNEKKR